MNLQSLIENYGYIAIFIGTFLEGETIVILAGFAAQLGFLELPWVIASAIAGSFSGDQLYFYLGRHWGPKIIARRLSWQESARKVYDLLHRHQYFLILTFRFYYGLRNVTPFAVGSAQVPRIRFFVLNLLGAIVWATVFGYAGYLSSEAMELFLGDLKRYELYAFGGIVVLAMAIWVFTLVRQRRRTRRVAATRKDEP